MVDITDTVAATTDKTAGNVEKALDISGEIPETTEQTIDKVHKVEDTKTPETVEKTASNTDVADRVIREYSQYGSHIHLGWFSQPEPKDHLDTEQRRAWMLNFFRWSTPSITEWRLNQILEKATSVVCKACHRKGWKWITTGRFEWLKDYEIWGCYCKFSDLSPVSF